MEPKKKNSPSRKIKKGYTSSSSGDQDVLLKLPAGLKYKVPGKRQRIIIGSIVIGLNVLLIIAVAVYFYSPAFQDFIYNFARK